MKCVKTNYKQNVLIHLSLNVSDVEVGKKGKGILCSPYENRHISNYLNILLDMSAPSPKKLTQTQRLAACNCLFEAAAIYCH